MVYVDNRDWPRYNETLVRRGQVLLDLDAVEEWDEEVKAMNQNKEGGQYTYPDGFIRLLAFIRLLFHLPYRQNEGFIHGLARYIHGLMTPDYSTVCRRVNALQIGLQDMEEDEEPLTIAVDSTGIKVSKRGDWIRRVWKVRRGWLKIHLAVDVKTKAIVAMDVTSERVGDNRVFKRLVKRSLLCRRVRAVLADGAYDAKTNFNWLAGMGVDAVIRVRSSSVPKSRGSMPRKLAVAEQLKDREAWRRRHRYGYRWRVEGVFSVLKRVFGEHVHAKRFRNMVREMLLKASLYNMLTRLTAKPFLV